MRAPILLSALGALTLCMSDARSQEPDPADTGTSGAAAAVDDRIAVDRDVWTTAGARVPALDLPVIVGRIDGDSTRLDGWRNAPRPEPRDLYNLLRTVDDDPIDRGVTKRTLLIQFASW